MAEEKPIVAYGRTAPEDEEKAKLEVLAAARAVGRGSFGEKYDRNRLRLEKAAKRYARIYDARHDKKE